MPRSLPWIKLGPLFMQAHRVQTILALAMPVIGGMLSQNVLNLVDTAIVGALGANALAAVGMASFLNLVAISWLQGLSSAVQATAARRVGEGRWSEAAVPLNGAILVAVVLGLPVTCLLFYNADIIFSWVVNDPEVIRLGTEYWEIRVLTVAIVGLNFSFRGYWNATHRPELYLYTLVLVHILNAVLSYCLVFGEFGFPEMGVRGAAIGTAVSVALAGLIYMGLGMVVARSQGFLHGVPNREQMSSLLRIGIPGSINQFFFGAGFAVLFIIIGMIGTDELAVANVLVNIILVGVLPGIGFGLAAATLVGQSLGAMQPEEAHRWGWDVSKVGAVVFVVLSLPMCLIPELTLSLFLHDPALVELGRLPVQITGFGMLIDGVGLIFGQALLGAGASMIVMRVAIFTQWGLFLPAAYLLGPVLGYGLLAVWIAMLSYRAVQTVWLIAIWQRRRWVHIQL